MLATGCLTQNAARASVNWAVITTIAAAFGISAAMENTGVANAIATTLVGGATGVGAGTTGVFVAVYVATFFLCNVVGNNAAAALMYPIAAGASEQQGIDPRPDGVFAHARGVRVVHVPVRVPDEPHGVRPGRIRLRRFSQIRRAHAVRADGGERGGGAPREQLVGGVGRGIGAIGGICVTRLVAAKFGEGEGKRDGEGPGMEKKNWRKSRRRKSPGRRWTAHAQTECCSRASCETSNAYRPPFSLLRGVSSQDPCLCLCCTCNQPRFIV